jgi:hypothetical protein
MDEQCVRRKDSRTAKSVSSATEQSWIWGLLSRVDFHLRDFGHHPGPSGVCWGS